MVLTGTFDIQLVLVSDAAQLSGAWRRPKVPAIATTGTNV